MLETYHSCPCLGNSKPDGLERYRTIGPVLHVRIFQTGCEFGLDSVNRGASAVMTRLSCNCKQRVCPGSRVDGYNDPRFGAMVHGGRLGVCLGGSQFHWIPFAFYRDPELERIM